MTQQNSTQTREPILQFYVGCNYNENIDNNDIGDNNDYSNDKNNLGSDNYDIHN